MTDSDPRSLGLGLSVRDDKGSAERHVKLPGNGVQVQVACFGCGKDGWLEIWFSPMKARATIRNGWTVRPKPEAVDHIRTVLLEVLCPECSEKRAKGEATR